MSDVKTEKISIIIPTYNRASIIIRTLDSVKRQTYQNWECIIVDDHSTDNTKDVITNYASQDSRFIYMLNERKKGAQGARNTGLFNCDSNWVFFFDSDNQLHNDCLQELVSGISESVDVVQCYSKVIDVDTETIKKKFEWCNYGNIQNSLYSGETYVDFNHAIIRKSKVLEIGGLDEDCPSMQEWDTHLRLSKTSCYNTIEKVLVDYYVGAKDAISTDNKRAIKGRLYILEKHLDEWKNHKIGFYRFVYVFNKMIQNCIDPTFKEESIQEINTLVQNRGLCVFAGYIINKWIVLKGFIPKANN